MLRKGANLVDICLSNELAAKNVINVLLKTKAFYAKCESIQPTNMSLAYSLVSLYFKFMTGKSS